MGKDHRIAALWIKGPLSYLEQLCLVSFRDAGHETVLYTYGEVPNIPDGIHRLDANEILPQAGILTHERTNSPALHSDLFRYQMLAKCPGTIWADTDAYCVRRFETETGHFYGWESEKHVNGGVLGLPSDCDTLRALLDFTSDPYAIPTWYGPTYVDELRAAKEAGNPVHVEQMPWGVWGPHAITHFLKETGEIRYAFPRHVLYPVPFQNRRNMLKRGIDDATYIKDDTLSIHFYGRRMRERLVMYEGGYPKPRSMVGRLLRKHGIDARLAPLPPSKKVRAMPPPVEQASPPAAPDYHRPLDPDRCNLTDLASKYGSDKGATKHRYTELYHMLFSPYRTRKIRLLEMGLLIGGPEHGVDVDRKTGDLPSIRLWLDYFTKAEIIALDVSDFSWFENERFSFVHCDMNDSSAVADAAKKIGNCDIIIDDASHASKHQQDAFLTFFPHLKSGGLYIIEDLRWQPPVYERKSPGITKTAALFQSFLHGGSFQHADAATAGAFNALRPQISGCFIFQVRYMKKRKDQIAVIHKL